MNNLDKPINQYSLNSLESWLENLGARKDMKDPSKWSLKRSDWKAIISFEKEDLGVSWEHDGKLVKRLFSYCINIDDVQNAILQGP